MVGTVKSAFTSEWALGDRVIIDFDRSIRGTITSFNFRHTREPTVEVSYFHNGEAKTAWIEQSRLSKAD